MQKQILDEELETGLLKMGPLAAFLLDARVDELQQKSYKRGVKTTTVAVRSWLNYKKQEVDAAPYKDTEYALGIKQALTELDGILKGIQKELTRPS